MPMEWGLAPKDPGSRLQFHGWGQYNFIPNLPNAKHVARLSIELAPKPLGFLIETDFALLPDVLNGDKANFVQKAYGRLKFGDNTELRFGRLSLSTYFANQSSSQRYTVLALRQPFGIHAQGFQLKQNIGTKWEILADVSTSSKYAFNDRRAWDLGGDMLEESGQLKYEGGPNAATMLSVQHTRLGTRKEISTWWKHDKLELRGSLYQAVDEKNHPYRGGYGLAEYMIRPHVALDLQADYSTISGQPSTIFTGGVRWFDKKDTGWNLMINYQKTSGKEQTDRSDGIMAGLRYRF